MEIVTQPDQLDALAAVRVPTLVMVGEEDQVFVEVSRAIAAAVPGARLVEIPVAGHSPQFENPEAWRSSLEDFLGSL
jgi:pimeloyl-ACP methyl ester carboxylesterase